MKHIMALLVKFAAVGTVLFSILGAFEYASLARILLITVITTAVAYFVGDLLLLPRFGNMKALMADFGLSFATVWVLSYMFIGPARFLTLATFFAALGITATEILFHMFMKKFVFNQKEQVAPGNANRQYATEFAEEQNDFKTTDKLINKEDATPTRTNTQYTVEFAGEQNDAKIDAKPINLETARSRHTNPQYATEFAGEQNAFRTNAKPMNKKNNK